MNIKSIDVRYFSPGGLYRRCEGMKHIKALPYLSVVQSVEGYYDVTLGNGPSCKTHENGVFIAPSAVVQTLVHHENKESGYMMARWIFLDVIINGAYRLDNLFEFPTILPQRYEDEAGKLLSSLLNGGSLCINLSEIYCLLDILLSVAKPKEKRDALAENIVAYICEHFTEKINYESFASALNVSQSTLFRKFKSEFGKTPANYINEFRILRASDILSTQSITVGDLARSVGFEDEFYFSKQFKKLMGVAPGAYRASFESNRTD